MNDKKYPWQRTFEDFAGAGIHNPSEMMTVSGGEAAAILEELADENWLPASYAGEGRHAGYTVCNAADSWDTALFLAGKMVGFYSGSVLWIGKAHRGLGLDVPLILTAAEHRGGSVLPPGVVFQGYSAASINAHRAAHKHAVATALATGCPVPAEVLEDIRSEQADCAAVQ